MDGKLVYTATGTASRTAMTLNVPGTVDYIVVKMMCPAAMYERGDGAVAMTAAADYGSTRIVRGGTAVAAVGGEKAP